MLFVDLGFSPESTKLAKGLHKNWKMCSPKSICHTLSFEFYVHTSCVIYLLKGTLKASLEKTGMQVLISNQTIHPATTKTCLSACNNLLREFCCGPNFGTDLLASNSC
jgi:hypothetical protein